MSVLTPPSFNVHMLPGPIGAEVSGIETQRPLPSEAVEALTRLVAERGVLVFRDQQLSPDEHVAFSAQFGPLEGFADQAANGNVNRHIFRVSNQGDGYDVGHYWHMDGSPWPQPTALSTLLALDVPDTSPTHTRFLSAAAAYEALPLVALKQRIDGLQWELATRVSPPVVRAHPLTGQPLLTLPFRFPSGSSSDAALRQTLVHLNRDIRPKLAGLSQETSEALTMRLVHHLNSEPGWEYAHAWRRGDLVLWDQRAVYHHATHSALRRVLHRTAMKGAATRAYRITAAEADHLLPAHVALPSFDAQVETRDGERVAHAVEARLPGGQQTAEPTIMSA